MIVWLTKWYFRPRNILVSPAYFFILMKENRSFSCWINTSHDQCFLNSSGIVTTSMSGIVYDKDTPAFDTIKHHYASLMLPVARFLFYGDLFSWKIMLILLHTKRDDVHWIAMVDLRGGAPSRPIILSISCSFFGKFGKIICWSPPQRIGALFYEESWIRTWIESYYVW